MSKIKHYVLKNYFLIHDLDQNTVDISYGIRSSGKIKVVNHSDSFFSEQSTKLNKNAIVWDNWLDQEIPFLFTKDKSKEIISIEDDGSVIINYDIIGSAFFFLSGWQELEKGKVDQHGRFPYESSLQKELGIIELPVVNYYYSILSKAICMAYGLNNVPQKFEKKNFVTFISHDIDVCQSGWIQDAFHQVKSKKVISATKIIGQRPFKKDHWFNFDRILEFEKKRNISSTFFFIPRRGSVKNVTEANADYKINSSKIKAVFDKIKHYKSEVGLHGSLGSGLDEQHMADDISRFPQKIIGNRYHFLMYEIDLIPSILDNCTLSYDNSVYFAEHIGFRHSTCTPFYLYNFSTEEPTKVIEIPLTIMDGTLDHNKYMGGTVESELEACKNTINEVAKFNGILSILWHNNYYSDYKYGKWESVLSQILDYVESLKTTYMSGKQLLNHINEPNNHESSNT